jgi:DNA-binding GntR family transcriptional regulator
LARDAAQPDRPDPDASSAAGVAAGSSKVLHLVRTGYTMHNREEEVTAISSFRDAGGEGRLAEVPRERAARVERPASFSEHVCQVLRDDIVSGLLPPGSRVTEASVMERTGVSRTPVREGLRRLEAEGLVITYRSRGTFVTYRLTAEEALLIYEVRLVLEPHLTRLAAERMTPDVLASIRGVLDRFDAAMDRANPREAGQLDADFHLTIYEASGSELLNVLRGYWTRLQLELSERVYATEVPRRFVSEHRGILEALERGDAPLAGERMAAHIEHGRKAIAKSLRESGPPARAGERPARP